MNVIGRVFLVLNLGLAGTFVAFAGTYLQRADDWKKAHTDLKTTTDAEDEVQNSEIAGLKKDVSAKALQLGSLTSVRQGLAAKLDEERAKNKSLMATLDQIAADNKQTKAYMAGVDTAIRTATSDAKTAMANSYASAKERDTAVTAKNAADATVAARDFEIKNLNTTVEEKSAAIAVLEQGRREDGILLAIVNRRYPGIISTVQPLVTGSVSNVAASGNLLTIALESGADVLKAGHRFAIFSTKDGYKGEATVGEIDKNKQFCFVRVTLKKGKIEEGDSASTNLSLSGNN